MAGQNPPFGSPAWRQKYSKPKKAALPPPGVTQQAAAPAPAQSSANPPFGSPAWRAKYAKKGGSKAGPANLSAALAQVKSKSRKRRRRAAPPTPPGMMGGGGLYG